MKVLVIGGNRFFGKRLVSLLLERGADVTLLNRGQRQDDFGTKVRRIHLDRKLLCSNHPTLGNEKWDIIYDQVCYDAQEVQGACEAFQGRTQHYVFISSQSVYKLGQNISEAAFDPQSYSLNSLIDRDTDYAEGKRQAEATFFKKADFPVTAVRFPIVLGEDDYTDRLKFHVEGVLKERPIYFPNIDAKISVIKSADAAHFLSTLLNRKFVGSINCCSRAPISLRELVKLIEKAANKEMKPAVKQRQGGSSPFGVESDWFMNVDKLTQLGFEAAPIDQWLPPLIEHLVKEIRLKDEGGRNPNRNLF